jgi:N-acetylglucosamine malate deacetylase 2
VAIDIGSMADGWCSKATRPTLQDISRFALGNRMSAGGTTKAEGFLKVLDGVGPIRVPTVFVVAHPDDETIAAAGTMTRFTQLSLIHVTDGAPQQPSPGSQDVGAVRRAEVAAALQAALAFPIEHKWYGYMDGAVVGAVGSLVERLVEDLAGAEIVVTHPYEGGHIDHDVCAFAVHRACAEMTRRGQRSPAIIEFACYHSRRGIVRAGEFWPAAAHPVLTFELAQDALQRRSSAFACHRSQEGNLRFFTLARERFRAAPRYNFFAAPPPGTTLYDKAAEETFQRCVRERG